MKIHIIYLILLYCMPGILLAETCTPVVKNKMVQVEFINDQGKSIFSKSLKVKKSKKYAGLISSEQALNAIKKHDTKNIKIGKSKLNLLIAGHVTKAKKKDGAVFAIIGGCPISKVKLYTKLTGKQKNFIHRDVIKLASKSTVVDVSNNGPSAPKNSQIETPISSNNTPKPNKTSNSAVVYEDEDVVIYNVYPDQMHISFRSSLIMLHKTAGRDTEVYKVTAGKIDVPAEVARINRMVIDNLGSRGYMFSGVKITHYIESHYIDSAGLIDHSSVYSRAESEQRKLEKALGKKHNVRGIPLAFQTFTLKKYPSDDLSLPDSWFVNAALANTFNKVHAQLIPKTYEHTIEPRRLAAAEVATEHSWQSNYDISIHGYEDAYPLLSVNKVDYYILINAESDGTEPTVVAIHDIKRSEYIMDIDVLVAHFNSRRSYLGYVYRDKEFFDIMHDILTPAVRRVNQKTSHIRIYHHVKGATFPSNLKNVTDSAHEKYEEPVFVSSFNTGTNYWKTYSANTKASLDEIRIFNDGRYSYDAKLKYLKKRQVVGRRSLPKEFYMAEEKEALKHATEEMLSRRKRYELWTDGFWLFQEMPMGQHIIAGEFHKIVSESDFQHMFNAYVDAFDNYCKNYIKNPVPLEYTVTETTTDGNGNVLGEEQKSHITIVEKDYVAKYKEYFEARKAEKGLDVWDILVNARRHGLGGGPRIRRQLDIINTVHWFVQSEECDSITIRRFGGNILQKATGKSAAL